MPWLHGHKCILEKKEAALTFESPLEQPSVTSVNYYNNDLVMGIGEEIGCLNRPPQNIAAYLLDIYFETLHPLFSIIGKTVFLTKSRSLYSTRDVGLGNSGFPCWMWSCSCCKTYETISSQRWIICTTLFTGMDIEHEQGFTPQSPEPAASSGRKLVSLLPSCQWAY